MLSTSNRNAQRRARDAVRRAAAAACECLEERRLFALVIQPFFDTDANANGLRIVESTSTVNANDNLVITEDPSTGKVSFSGSFASAPGSFFNVELFDIRTGGGNDTVTWNVTTDYDNDNRSIFVDLGVGNDSFAYNLPDAADVDFTNGTTVLLDVLGQSGNDTITVDVDDVAGDPETDLNIPLDPALAARFNVQVNAGEGNDTVNAFVECIEGGGQLDVLVELGNGNNRLNASLEDVEPESTATYTITGGDSTGTQFDGVDLDLLDDIAGDLNVFADLGGGNDSMTVDLGFDFDVDGGEARFNLNGKAGDDRIAVRTDQTNTGGVTTVNGTPLAAPTIDGLLDIYTIGGTGNDTLTVDLRETGANTGAANDGIDLLGTLKIRQHGQIGNDTLNTDLLFTAASTGGVADVIVTGDSGNDTANFALRDFSAGGVTYTGGFAVLDGGADNDTRAFFQSGGPQVRVQRFETVFVNQFI